MAKIRYSFIIPVKDQISHTRDCLLSWFAHTSDFVSTSEILLVDDESHEDTKSFLSTLPSPVKLITNESNLGFAKSNNKAANQAQGEFLILLNNDLVLQRGWFDALLSACNSSDHKRIVGNVQLSRIDGRVDHVGKYFDEEGDPRHFGQLFQELFPWNPPVDFYEFPSVTAACWMLKKELFESLNGFDESYQNGFEDDDLCMRARSKGVQVGVAFRSWIYHYVSTSSGRKTHESKNHQLFKSRWGDETKKWYDEHFEETLRLLKSWSLSY